MSSLASGSDRAASLPPASLDRRFYAFALDRGIAKKQNTHTNNKTKQNKNNTKKKQKPRKT